MAQYSMWLNGRFRGDNIKNVDWECGKCHVRIPDRSDGISHIRAEHGEGTLYPRLSDVGKRLAMFHYYQDASKRLAKILVESTEYHFCKSMGAEPIFVKANTSSERASQRFRDNHHLFVAINNMLIETRHKVEQNKGYISLTNSQDSTRVLRSESEIQVTLEDWFHPKCEYMDLNLTREGETGRGLLDFKFSYGNDLQCFLEVKLFESSQLEHGVEIQLPTYLQAQNIQYGVYVPIAINPTTYETKVDTLGHLVEELNSKNNFEISMIDIKAWKPEPASKAEKLDDPNRYEIIR
jgi:hypothetical protein